MNWKPDTVMVARTSTGGTVYICEDGSATILVMQHLYSEQTKGIKIQKRVAELREGIDRVISLGLQPGDRLSGKIVIRQQPYPVDQENEDLYKLKDDKGEPVIDTKGDCVWIYSYYSEDPEDKDDDILLSDLGKL